jgi:PIN domain nuclease of toxin-antitoxin system
MKEATPVVAGGRYLLDTRALLYMDQAPALLPAGIRRLVADTQNRLFVSVASLWEIQIKCIVGKLILTLPVERLLLRQQRENDIEVLPIEIGHITEHVALALHHRDPFDRMLIAQARVEGLTLLSHDAAFKRYDVVVRW